ncbi:cbb3-type cytochrome c oxidase subunit 3 [Ectothiorhodospiraceae bacterium WFHF3C12]|nr:cbb3-type cytochrome c oxidase subunit 3 [Ectothiorhodospiraceae bacterium WFHF3C12]
MDLGTLSGLVTLALMIIFIGIVIWAYSSKRKKDFDEAARLPLDAEQNNTSESEREGKGHE